MQTTEQIIRTIKTGNRILISVMLKDLIDAEKVKKDRVEQIYGRYDQRETAVPIMTRKYANYEKAHNRLPHDFVGDITDMKVGYMGNAVKIELSKEFYMPETDDETPKVLEGPDKAKYESHSKVLKDFHNLNNAEDSNSDMVQMASLGGVGFRLLYIAMVNKQKVVKYKNIPPYECILFVDGTTGEPQYGMIYYKIEVRDINTTENKILKKEKLYVEWYDEKQVYYFLEDDKGVLEPDFRHEPTQEPHWFDGVPIIAFPNNTQERGNCEKVLPLIDAYDRVFSDGVNEIEQLRSAYMWAKGAGMNVDDAFMKQIEQTGVFPLSEDGSIGFVEKNLTFDGLQSILKEARRNIYQFAKSVDLSVDQGGDKRVIGWQIALLNLENDCKETERKFIAALNRQYKLITQFWTSLTEMSEIRDFDHAAITYTFTRNFPRDLYGEMQTLEIAIGLLSRETAYSLMSFIDDPGDEKKAFDLENKSPLDLNNVNNINPLNTGE